MKSSARDGDSDDGVLGAGRGAADGAASDAAELSDGGIPRPYAGPFPNPPDRFRGDRSGGSGGFGHRPSHLAVVQPHSVQR
ncbi:hypothetical protein GCM10027162_47190 [Streptomyces incanus]